MGGGSRTSLKRVVEIIEAHAGRKGRWNFAAREAGDPRHTGADTTRAREEIGYEPRVGLEEGLRRQVEWNQSLLPSERR